MAEDKKKDAETSDEKLDRDNKKRPGKVKNDVIIDPSLEEIQEAVLTVAQRRKRAMTMRKYKGKMKMARERMKKRKASPEKLKKRAKRAAINAMKKKVAGGKDYNSMSPGEKAMVDRRVQARKAAIERLAKRMLIKVRQAELEKFRTKPTVKTESAVICDPSKFILESTKLETMAKTIRESMAPKAKSLDELFGEKFLGR